MPDQSPVMMCRNACADCKAQIPVPLRRATNGGPTSAIERALHREHRKRCDHCAELVRLHKIKALGNIAALKRKCMLRSKKWADRSAAARHARKMAA